MRKRLARAGVTNNFSLLKWASANTVGFMVVIKDGISRTTLYLLGACLVYVNLKLCT